MNLLAGGLDDTTGGRATSSRRWFRANIYLVLLTLEENLAFIRSEASGMDDVRSADLGEVVGVCLISSCGLDDATIFRLGRGLSRSFARAAVHHMRLPAGRSRDVVLLKLEGMYTMALQPKTMPPTRPYRSVMRGRYISPLTEMGEIDTVIKRH